MGLACRPPDLDHLDTVTAPNQLVADLAERLAGVGRLRLVPDALTAGNAGGVQAHTATNTEAATNALTRLSVTALVPPGPALLIDDTTRSGFTLTIAAYLLREAGAGAVYPPGAAQRDLIDKRTRHRGQHEGTTRARERTG